jgi:hypothetical protein
MFNLSLDDAITEFCICINPQLKNNACSLCNKAIMCLMCIAADRDEKNIAVNWKLGYFYCDDNACVEASEDAQYWGVAYNNPIIRKIFSYKSIDEITTMIDCLVCKKTGANPTYFLDGDTIYIEMFECDYYVFVKN